MKNLKFIAFTFVAMLLISTNVYAKEVNDATDLLDCIANSGTCTLTDNIDLADRFVIETGKDIVLDLNGKTLNVNKILENNYSVFVKGNLTIQGNGTMNIANEYGIAVTGNLTIKNSTFNHEEGIYLIGSYGTTTIENGVFNADYCAVNAFSGNTIIKDGVFNSNPYPSYGEDETKLYYWGILYDEPNGAKLEVQKGTFNQILSWANVLADNAKVNYVLEQDNLLDDPVEIKGEVTIDLNGKTVSFDKNSIESGEDSVFTVLRGGKLIINDSKGTGKITAGDSGKIYTAIKMTKLGETANGELAELVVNKGNIEGYYYAITGNGNRHDTKITINNGTLKSTAATGLAIFNPQDGEIIVNGGDISGSTGIEMRAGKLVVNGGTITGTNNELTNTANGSGSTSAGAGIAIAQHTTALSIDVTINGGTIKGKAPIYQVNPQKLDEEGYKKITVKLTNGKFETINNGTVAVFAENDRVAITGGTYSTDVKDYVTTGLVSKKIGETYVVAKENKITITENENGKLSVDKTTAIVGEKVIITASANDGYKLNKIKVVDSSNKEIEVINNEFVMPNSPVTITIECQKTTTTIEIPKIDPKEEVEEVTIGIKEVEKIENILADSVAANEELAEIIKNTNVTVGVEVETIDTKEIPDEIKTAIEKEVEEVTIAEYFDISIVVRDETDQTEIDTISELTEEIELMILLPEKLKNSDKGINRKYYVIREHEGEITKIEANLSEDGKYLTFKSKLFSTYALAYADTTVDTTKNPQTGDNVITYFLIGIISLIAFATTGLFIKKSYNK